MEGSVFVLTCRADVFEGGGGRHAEGASELPDQLPGVQRVAQVDEAGGAVHH